ncbi:MAG: tRNA (guanosine(37)-N1)-methyltransferase TrmD [Hymenobacteraceae bacterium]|nr:tRNA (guanosine(37)-N1)-methyltransferase TrmD [Hymenobacteraceae bacterium]
MRIDILTCQPELLDGPFRHSILKRAAEKGLVEIHLHQLRQWAVNKHGQIDDYAFGGGAGMVLMAEPLVRALRALSECRTYDAVIFLTPDGEPLRQPLVNRFSLLENVVLICGHYKGIDERVRERYVTHEVSIGDYVLSGGELAAAVLTDAIVRLLPGVLNNEESALTDSFQDGLLAPPVYTRPATFEGMQVPAVLQGGDHVAIENWRFEQAVARTRARRPDLLT